MASNAKIFGILNITDDSFSDAGKYLEPEAAISHGRKLARDGADVVDIGAASSNPMSRSVPPEVEIARLSAVVPALTHAGISVSIDSYALEVQRWALRQGIAYLNDVQGFPFSEFYPELAASETRLIVMHAVQGLGPATRVVVDAGEIFERIVHFFDARLAQLEKAGIAKERLIIDPGMGLFLGTRREASFAVLRRLSELKARYRRPVLISVSRKSFLRNFLGRSPQEAGPASLAAELYAVLVQGVDCVRTHDPASLNDALAVWKAIDGPPGGPG
jgi:dihydropteroate synthase type 2